MLVLFLFLFCLGSWGKVILESNYPLEGNNLQKVLTEKNYEEIVQIIRSMEVVKNVRTEKKGEDVIIYVERYPVIRKIIISGNRGVSRQEILGVLGLAEGAPITEDFPLKEIEERVKELYADKGFLEAKVAVTLSVDQRGYAELYVGIDEGDLFFLKGGVYEGSRLDSKFLDRKLGIVEGRVFSKSQIEEKLPLLQDTYLSLGFWESFVYYEGVKGEVYPRPFWRVLMPLEPGSSKNPLHLAGALMEGLSTLFTHPIATFKALTGKGHVAHPIFRVVEGRRYHVTFEGNSFFNGSLLLKATQLPQKGVDPFSLEEAVEGIRELYKTKGFIDASVSYQVKDENIVFRIQEGQRYFMVIGDKEEPYDEEKLEEIKEEILEDLKKDGYLLAEVDIHKRVDTTAKKVYVEFKVNKGKKQILKDIVYEGEDKDIREFFRAVQEKLPTFYDTKIIENLNLQLDKYFKEKGYMEGDFSAEVRLEEDKDAVFYTYLYKVTKGERYRLGEDVYYGYKKISQRELSYMTVRDEYYYRKLDDMTLYNFYTSDIFSGVRIQTFVDRKNKKVHRLIQLQEDKRGYYDLAVGYNTQDRITLGFQLGLKDLMGLGVELKGMYARSSKREAYRLSVGDKFFFTRNLWINGDIFKEWSQHRSYSLTSKGVAVAFGYRITPYTSIGTAFSVTDNSVLGSIISLRKYSFFLLREYRDDIFSPQRLHYDNLTFTVAEGERRYTKLELNTYYLIPLQRGSTLVLKVAGGSVGKGAPIFDRFFLGGLKDMRGYSYEEIGQPSGGRYYLFGRTELEISVRGPFVVIPFYEMGGVSDRISQIDIKHSFGVSAGFQTPVGPVRFDIAFPGEKNFLRRVKFYVSVGYLY